MDGVSSGRTRRKGSKVSAKGRAYLRLAPKRQTRNPRAYQKAMKKTYKKTRGASRHVPVLSACTHDYLKAMYDPWNLKNAPCVPDLIQIPSYKFSTRIRGTLYCNAAGAGSISMNPFLPSNFRITPAVTNQDYLAPVWHTDGTQGGLDNLVSQCLASGFAPPTGYVPDYWNSMISGNEVAQLMDNIEGNYVWRPVGGGIKLVYNGALDSRSGSYILYEDPSNSGWLGTRTASATEFLKFEESTQTVVDGNEVAVLYRPKNNMDLDYSDNWYMARQAGGVGVLSNSEELAQYQTISILIQGAQASGGVNASFNYECIMHWEAIGTGLPSRTVSHSDVTGMGQVNNLADPKVSPVPPAKNLKGKEAEFAKAFKQYGPAARSIVSAYMPEAGGLFDLLSAAYAD